MSALAHTANEDVIGRLMEEGPIGMGAAAKLVGTFREGKPTSSITVSRWANKGVRLADGRIVKLEAFRLNTRLCTSRAALLRFIRAQNEDPREAKAESPSIICGEPSPQ